LGLHEDIQQGKLILFVGRLQEQKAPLRLIDSFKSYSQDDPHSRLIMIGEGNLLSAVEKSINRLNLGQQVTLLKSIKQEELVKYYQAADILLLTSNYEGMPMSVLEALGCGLPIVTTNAGEVKRIVKNGFSGEVVEGFEPQDIANAIKKVLNAPSVYTSQNCIKSVEDYTPQKVLASVYDLMRKNL
jgi:glycosyltransferase involved in cell wall biosynthesis